MRSRLQGFTLVAGPYSQNEEVPVLEADPLLSFSLSRVFTAKADNLESRSPLLCFAQRPGFRGRRAKALLRNPKPATAGLHSSVSIGGGGAPLARGRPF
jgi:hypothetical protein